MSFYPSALEKVIHEFSKYPGIGKKSAEKLAFYVLKSDPHNVDEFCKALIELKQKTRFCERCYNITEDILCSICTDHQRNQKELCVVEQFKDIISIEKTHEYKGLYHVTMGHLSPLDGIGPNQLKIPQLFERIKTEDIDEVILATNPNVEGDATALYIAEKLKTQNIKVSRIARGLPIGGDLEFADPLTLSKSLAKRELLNID